MDSEESASARSENARRLEALEQQLATELSKRGFDPSQVGNIPLTGPLAKLTMEIDRLRIELESDNNDIA